MLTPTNVLMKGRNIKVQITPYFFSVDEILLNMMLGREDAFCVLTSDL